MLLDTCAVYIDRIRIKKIELAPKTPAHTQNHINSLFCLFRKEMISIIFCHPKAMNLSLFLINLFEDPLLLDNCLKKESTIYQHKETYFYTVMPDNFLQFQLFFYKSYFGRSYRKLFPDLGCK